MEALQDAIETLTSYFASFLAMYMPNLTISEIGSTLYTVGGAILLVARLVVDVPKAIKYLKERN